MLVVAALQFSVFNFQFSVCSAQTNTWHAYMSYYEPQQIVKAGDNNLFVRASNGLYQYNLTDHSITTYDKMRQLNDSYIEKIAWNQKAKRLIVVYNNSNIDLIDLNGNVTNMSSLYTKSMTQDKTVNNIYINDVYAYLATGFGVMKINMERLEVSESYILNQNIINIGISDGTIYVQNNYAEVSKGAMNTNLIDFHNWTTTTSWPDGIFNIDNSDWNNYIEEVRTLKTDGPKYNNFDFMRFKHGRLYTVGGGFSSTIFIDNPGTVQILKDGEWQILPDNLKQITGREFSQMKSVDAMPDDPDHIFVSGRTGLYEYRNGEFYKEHTWENSPLERLIANGKPIDDYLLTFGMAIADNGDLWCLNSMATQHSLLQYTKDGQWISHHKNELMYNESISMEVLERMLIDSRGYIWFLNNHWRKPTIFCYDPVNDRFVKIISSFINQDGKSYSGAPVTISEDLDGNIWLGMNFGLYMIENDRVSDESTYMTQVKVPRNDGTNLADYLLTDITIRDIVVDGGNRKWIATQGSGIYLISSDNMTELAHYTTENSPILSDNVMALAINNETGELFIGTDIGLCSYITDATTAVETMDKSNVYAYPNPVVSGYNGLITIVGLSRDADVKILSTSGQLVAQGRSNGGTFTWNGRDRQGRRVASGVYMVAAATSEGKKGTVCKIAVIN